MNKKLPRVALLLGLAALGFRVSTAQAASTINTTNHYAWGGNSGWIDFRSARPNASDGVSVTDSFLAGYAWSPNTGWIHFGNGSPADAIRYANTGNADYGVNHDGVGNLSGLAWSPNTGWINFGWAASGNNSNTNRPRFDLTTGDFSGYAWSANCGWINLGGGLLRTDSMIRFDSDGDGIADSWERARAGSLPVLTSTGDADGDGLSDRDEYILDTDPLTPSAPLRITRISKMPNLNVVELEWASQPTRIYSVEGKPDLGAAGWFHLGDLPGSASRTTSTPIEAGVPAAFFRVGAKLPLMP